MHNDLIGKFKEHATARAMWDVLKLKYGGTSTTKLRDLNIQFDSYKMCPKYNMEQHLRTVSTMIRELKSVGNNLTKDRKIQAGILFFRDSWETMVISMTHNETLKPLMVSHSILSLKLGSWVSLKLLKLQDPRAPMWPTMILMH